MNGTASPCSPGFVARAVLRLSFIEVWERYSFFTLFALLPLFVAGSVAKGGMGWSPGDALRFFGIYLLAVQVAPVAGGYIADRWLGAKLALRFGAMGLLLGHAVMAAVALHPGATGLFYASVALVAAGNGLFKPVLTVIVGRLPHVDEAARASAFTTFFLFLNLGGLVSLILGGWLAESFGWVWAFAASASGMAIAIVAMTILEPRYIRPFARDPASSVQDKTVVAARSSWPLAVGVLFVTYIVTCSFSYQSYGFVNLFTARLVDRSVAGFSVPPSWFGALNPIAILALSPVLVWFWDRKCLGYDWRPTSRVAASLFVMAGAFAMLAAAAMDAATHGLAHPGWVIGGIVLIAAGELLFTPALNAAVTRLLPAQFQNVGMGALAAAAGIGAWLSGRIGALAMEGDMAAVLPIVAAAAVACGLLLIISRRPLRTLTL